MKKECKQISLFLQAIIISFIIICLVVYLFIPELIFVVEVLVSAFLLLSAYNNNKIFKRPYLTFLYTISSLLFLISAIMDTFGR